MAGQETTKIFVVGRGGNGKTMTTQTIVGENNRVVYKSGNINVISSADDKVEVADGTGVGEPLEDLTIDIGDIIKSVDDVMERQFSNTLTAIVLVYKFGVRFTMQENKCLLIVKDIFGHDVIRQRGVVVLTYGDNFDENVQGTFHDWCRVQEGAFKSLMEECNYRCVLFDNRDGSKRESQVKEFMKAVEEIDATIPYVYTPDKVSKEKLINEYEMPQPIVAEEKHIVEKPKYTFMKYITMSKDGICLVFCCFCYGASRTKPKAPKLGDTPPKDTD